MATFGLVCEGPTDQIVLANILWGFFNNPNIRITELQPELDETDRERYLGASNWQEVFRYCASESFQEAFQQLDYIIVQIDTDVLRSNNVPKEYQMQFKHPDGQDFTVEEIVTATKNKLIEAIGIDFHEQFQNRILFAISVHSIECWLLPLYYSNQRSRANRTENCLNVLNQALQRSESFFIHRKELRYYRTIAEKYKRHRVLIDSYQLNPSLKIFIESLPALERSEL